MKNYNFVTFLRLKVLIFHIFCVITKNSTRLPHNLFCSLERVCLILQNTINLEKWQDFNLKNFNYLV